MSTEEKQDFALNNGRHSPDKGEEDDEQVTVTMVIRETRLGWRVIMTGGMLGSVVLVFRREGASETRGWHK